MKNARTAMTRSAVTALLVLTLLSLLVLTGCGAGNDNAGDSPGTTQAAPSGQPGVDRAQFKKIRTCLKAAGLADKIPNNIPSNPPSGIPSSGFTGTPSGIPSDLPSGGPSGGLGALQDSDVQQALQACGISLQPGGPTAGSS